MHSLPFSIYYFSRFSMSYEELSALHQCYFLDCICRHAVTRPGKTDGDSLSH